MTPPSNKNSFFSSERIWASAPLRSENYWFSLEIFGGLDSTKKYLFLALVGISATFYSYKRGKT